MSFFSDLLEEANHLANLYGLNAGIFAFIYFLSIIPVYGGYLLIILGAGKQISFENIIHFKFSRVKFNQTILWGIIMNIFGLLMPYLYIIIFGRNFPLYFYLVVGLIMFILIFGAFSKFKNIFNRGKTLTRDDIEILKSQLIYNESDKKKMWQIYDYSFVELNKNAPCKQSFDEHHFMDLMDQEDVTKYQVFLHDTNELVGMGMITNNFNNTPWISGEYFKAKFGERAEKGLIYYFMGIAIAEKYRHKGYASALIKKMTDDLPEGAIIGFDNSKKTNFFIPEFSYMVGKKRKTKYLDSQNYYIVY